MNSPVVDLRSDTVTRPTAGMREAMARAGAVAALGIGAGCFVHIFAVVNIGWAAAAWLTARVGLVRKSMHWLERLAGAMFLGFGLKLALSDNPRS